MNALNKITKVVDSEEVQYGLNLHKDLHKKLCLGQTRWVCRYGTLSDGHEMITDAQRYFSAIKQIYYLALNIQSEKASAMEAEADWLDAQKLKEIAVTEADLLRAQAKALKAETRLTSCMVTVEDQLRQIDEFNKVRKELEPIVNEKYPEGIEQSEEDSWSAVFKYRTLKSGNDRFDNVPLPPELKLKLGIEFKDYCNTRSALAPYLTNNLKDVPKFFRIEKGPNNV